MSVDPDLIRAEQFAEIGELLQDSASVIIDRWCRRAIQEQPQAKRVHHAALRDALVTLLTAMGRNLAECSDEPSQHRAVALEHGGQRWDVGWSLEELVRDYQILRLVVVDFLEDHIDRPLRSREVMAIGLTIDEAVEASVQRYVKFRDEFVREQETHRTASELAAAEKLRQAERRKDDFLSTLAHELRNPLSPIQHAVEVLRIVGPGDPAVGQMRDIIERQVQHIVRLVDDLLDLTRVSQGKLELRRQAVDLATVAAQAIQTCTVQIEARQHQLSVNLPTEPLRVEADPDRLLQIICNLLNNAAKYTDPGGRIWLTCEAQNDEVVISVRDSGIGIPLAMLDDVFDMYRQVDGASPRSQGGLGIGLTLVRSLVQIHGGSVVAHSGGPGQGSTFVVRLPLGDPARSDQDHRGPQPAVVARRILIVEDNSDTRDLLRDLLQLTGHTVFVAANGQEGLAAVEQHAPEIALVDIGLPGLDGYEVCKQIRALPGGAKLLLIALTGYGQPEDRRRALEAGFDAHLVKPVKLEDLTQIVSGR